MYYSSNDYKKKKKFRSISIFRSLINEFRKRKKKKKRKGRIKTITDQMNSQ